jgi:biopolymer transport protein ExbD
VTCRARSGKLYVNGDLFTDDKAAVARIKEIAATTTKPKAIIAGDRKTAYGGVMRAIQLVHDANVTSIALENERP